MIDVKGILGIVGLCRGAGRTVVGVPMICEAMKKNSTKKASSDEEQMIVVVAEDCSYALFYNEADVVLPTPAAKIKIHVIAEHWANIYAYTFNPTSCGTWPGTLVENGVIEVAVNFEGLVLSNGEGAQTADIKDIDMTKEEVWITVNEDNSVTVSYEAPVVDQPTPPVTGDHILSCVLVLALSAAGIVMLAKKKEF